MAQNNCQVTPANRKRKRNTPANSAAEEPSPDQVFDPKGDLLLRATEAGSQCIKIFLVNRTCLCLASPVFRAMLGPDSPFMEGSAASTTEKTPVVKVEEDNVDVLSMLLAIFHFKNNMVEKRITYRRLYDIALLCDKYDCSESLRPWSAIWVRPFIDVDLAKQEGLKHCLFIAWALQSEELFATTTTFLIRNCQLTRGGKLFIDDSSLTIEDGPSAVIDEIKKLRNLHIRAIQKTVLQKITSVWDRDHTPCNTCEAFPETEIQKCLQQQVIFLTDAFPDVTDQRNPYGLYPLSLRTIKEQACSTFDDLPDTQIDDDCLKASKLEYLVDFVKDRFREIEGIGMPKR